MSAQPIPTAIYAPAAKMLYDGQFFQTGRSSRSSPDSQPGVAKFLSWAAVMVNNNGLQKRHHQNWHNLISHAVVFPFGEIKIKLVLH